MTSHSKTFNHKNWRRVKSGLIGLFGTIRAAAAKWDCHPNAIRLASQGQCPRILKRLQKAGLL